LAHLHFKRTVYKSGGNKASARLEYITGRTVRARDLADRQLRYIREGREDLVVEETRNLPAWAAGNPHTYFRAAEQYERLSPNDDTRRGVAFEEWKITLPQELTRVQNLVLVNDLIDIIAGDRLSCTYAFHEPRTLDGTKLQPHIHLLISARRNDDHARSAEQHFKRWNKDHPERGGAQKDPAFWHKGAIKAHRVLISDLLNIHLEQAGQMARVHPDTLVQRTLDRQPEPKLLPSESRAYREEGIISERMQEVLDIRQERAAQRVREQNNARAYWEQRKVELGITRDLPINQKLYAITQARLHVRDQVPAGPSRGRVQGEARQVPRERKAPIRERTATTRHHRTPRQAHTGDLASQVQRLTQRLAREDECQAGAALRVRLHEEEREREQGLGF
jgi:hypothetical protein